MRALNFLFKTLSAKRPVRSRSLVLSINGMPYACIESTRYGHILAPVDDPGRTFLVTQEEFNRIMTPQIFRA